MLQILNWKIGKLRKFIRVWSFDFVPLLSLQVIKLTYLQGRVVTFIQQHKALSLIACISSVVLLVNFFLLVPAQSSLTIAEKSQFVSQPTCLSCSSSNTSSSTKSRDKYQEPFVFPPRHAAATNTPPSSVPVQNPTTNSQTTFPTQGSMNLFPYGSCTWWANQRYFQLHGIFVPWRTQSNAWQWTARAYQFGWHVSISPVVGAIIDLQPGVQGASWAGHVAVVERILRNGDVIASNMNWGTYPWQVTNVEFAPGPGVTFLYL
jgi:surface antigen